MSSLGVRATENGVLVGNRLLSRAEALSLFYGLGRALGLNAGYTLAARPAASPPPLDSPPPNAPHHIYRNADVDFDERQAAEQQGETP